MFDESTSCRRAPWLLSGRFHSLFLLSRGRLLEVGIGLGRVSHKVCHVLTDSLGGGGGGSRGEGNRGCSRLYSLGLDVLAGRLHTLSDGSLV